MKIRFIPKVALLTAAVFGTGVAVAQQVVVPAAPAYRSVADVLKNPVDDMPVILEGFIVKKVSREKYLFTDGTGEIRIEIDDEDLPATPITDKTRVRINGEVERDFLVSPEIDVDVVTPL